MKRAPLLILALLAAPASSDETPCPGYGDPSGLKLGFKDFSGGTGTDIWVEGTWDVAPWSDLTFEWVGWYLERKDGDGVFQHHADVGVVDNPTNGYFLNFVRNTANCAASCLEKGGTYTFRAAGEWRWKPGCPNFDGVTHRTSFTNEATIRLTEEDVDPPPGGNAPKDVLAIGDAKKPRVTITWTASETKPDFYVIKRVQVLDPAKGPRAEAAYAEVGRVKGSASAFTDKRIAPDEIYDYVVEALLNGESAESVVDRAFGPGARCLKSQFRLWNGAFSFDVDGVRHDVHLLDGGDRPGAFSGHVFRADAHGRSIAGGLDIDFESLGAFGGSTSAKAAARIGQVETQPDQFASGIVASAVGKLGMSFVQADPFDPLAFRRLEGTMLLKAVGQTNAYREFVADRIASPIPGLFQSYAQPCDTIGVGSTKPLRVGAGVIVAYEIVNVGQQPLFSRRLQVRVTVRNGELDSALGPLFRGPEDVSGLTEAVFAVGAIGPKSATRSEVATLLLGVHARSPADGKNQLTVTVRMEDNPAAPFSEEQTLTIRNEDGVVPARIVEIPIAKPPAKR